VDGRTLYERMGQALWNDRAEFDDVARPCEKRPTKVLTNARGGILIA
jgi:hypothetical protein